MHSENTLGNDESIELPHGLIYLIGGYNEYIKDIIKSRAIVGIDGMKPVHRRIFYTLYKMKAYGLQGSADVAGQVMQLHPHSDAGIYDTMTRLTQNSEYMQVTFIEGEGFFGKSNSNETPSDKRYTQVTLKGLAEELYRDLDGVQFVPNYNDTKMEPELLPAAFPLVLCNASSGIAIGVASNIIPGNFNEILAMTVEYIKTGKIAKPMIPDFPGGGEYIYNEKQLNRIMHEGRGKVRLRARWEISGKKITIKEIPYYTTIQRIIKQLDKENIPGLSSYKDITDLEKGFGLLLECSNLRVVDDVLARCLHLTDLQLSVSANMNVIIDGIPTTLGVIPLLDEWLKHRHTVVLNKHRSELETIQRDIPRYDALIKLIQSPDTRSRYTEVLFDRGKEAARDVIRAFIPGVTDDVLGFIGGRELESLAGMGRNAERLMALRAAEQRCLDVIDDPNTYIVKQLEDLNKKYIYPRRTVVSQTDFVTYEASELEPVKAMPKPVIVIVDGLFIKKIQVTPKTDVEGINCMSNDTLCLIDDRGRFIRVQLDAIEYCKETERGTYLPVYLGTPEDEFKVIVHDRLSDKKVGFVYSDGYASVLDYSEWLDSRKVTKVVLKGVSEYAGSIVGEVELDSEYLFVMTKKKRFGFVPLDFKHKHRTARTKLISVKKDDAVDWVFELTEEQMRAIVPNADAYMGSTSELQAEDTFDGVYLENLMTSKQV